MSIVSSIGKNIGNLAVRTVGLTAVGITAYDAHVMGKLDADVYSQSNEADRLTSAAYNSTYLEQPSAVMGKIKKKIFNFQVDNSIFMPFDAAIGYVKGFCNSCVDSFIPGLLGLGALFGGRVSSKVSALGLLIYGGYKFIADGIGLGRPNRLNPPYK